MPWTHEEVDEHIANQTTRWSANDGEIRKHVATSKIEIVGGSQRHPVLLDQNGKAFNPKLEDMYDSPGAAARAALADAYQDLNNLDGTEQHLRVQLDRVAYERAKIHAQLPKLAALAEGL